MSAKTKILVVKMRELIYTAIFLALIILLIVLLVAMFSSDDAGESEHAGENTGQEAVLSEDAPADETGTEENQTGSARTQTARYTAGVYTVPVTLGDSAVDVEVIVDESRINSIRLVNLSESITAMYPLVSPSLDEIAAQVCERQSLENITCPENNKYTSQLLLNAIAQALQNASKMPET